MYMRARGLVLTTWTRLSRLGVDVAEPDDSRAIAGANRFFILAVVANLPWLVVLAILGGATPAPVATHLMLVLVWGAGLWLNRLGLPLLASLLGLLAPIMEYAYLTGVYSRGAAFQLQLLAIPALSFSLLPARRWAVRLAIGLLGVAVLIAIYVMPTFETPTADISADTVHMLAVLNVISTLTLLYTIAAFNNYYFQRERNRNAELA